ncbi:MAG TPA: amidase [Solirubrobacteraceae bacterium]|jgi:amidase
MDATELAFAGLVRQADLIAAGEISSRELVDLYLERIARIDPKINAFRVVFAERARTEADQADGRRGAGEERPLLGVPVAIKDDVDVAGEVTAYGTDAHGPPVAADAEVVRHLRAAGAVIIGKTNVPELTIFPFTETANYGITRNPWDLQRTPGGSSGGSGAAVAAGLVGGALGSDGAGSIRIPAGCCGLFGLKPQRGRISMAPAKHVWHGLSVLGPLTRRVEDAARFYDATKASGPSFTDAVRRSPGKLRVAVSFKVPPPITVSIAPEQRAAVESTAELLRSLGHEVIERDPDYGMAFLGVLAKYLRGIHDAAEAMPHKERLARRTKGYARLGGLIPAGVFQRALAAEAADRERINRVFDGGVDVLLTPVFTRKQLPIGEYEGRGVQWTLNGSGRWVPHLGAFNHTGQPAAAVPAGFTDDGLPLSVQFVAPPDGEPVLLSLAAQLEEARPWADRRPPIAA